MVQLEKNRTVTINPGCGREATPVSFKVYREVRIEDNLKRLHLHCLGAIQLGRELYFPDSFYRSTLPSCQNGCDSLYLSCSLKMSELWLPTSLPAIVASDIAASLCRILDQLFFFPPLLAICCNLVPRWDTQKQPDATQHDLVRCNTPDSPSTLGNRCVLVAVL